jgi:hypothetical protein
MDLSQDLFLDMWVRHVFKALDDEGKRLLVLQLMINLSRTCRVPVHSYCSWSSLLA